MGSGIIHGQALAPFRYAALRIVTASKLIHGQALAPFRHAAFRTFGLNPWTGTRSVKPKFMNNHSMK
jgi:hypothetical protein